MTKIKPRLIIYNSSQPSALSKHRLKKRLYLSNLEAAHSFEPLSFIKRISKAQICKYAQKNNFTLSSQTRCMDGISMHTSQFFSFNSSETIIAIKNSNTEKFSTRQKIIFKRFLRKQKNAQKITLKLPSKHPMNLNLFKSLFWLKRLKGFHLKIQSPTPDNFKLLSTILQSLNKRKPWISLISQKATINMLNRPEGDLNGYITRCLEGLLGVKELLKETNTQLKIWFDSVYRFESEIWKRFMKILEDLESLKRLELTGVINGQEFESILEAGKDLKSLEKIDFRMNYLPSLQFSTDYLKGLGESLLEFSLATSNFNANNSNFLGFVTELKRLSRLKHFSLEGSEATDAFCNFLQPLSESLRSMADLESLRIVLRLEKRSDNNIIKDGIESIFHTIGSLSKLEGLSLGFGIDETNSFGFEVLCKSLRNLKNLRSLGFNLAMPSVGDREIEPLLMILPDLKELEEIYLTCMVGQELGENTMVLILKNMARLRWLRKVVLSLKCSGINDQFVSVFGQTMSRLRYLKEFELSIEERVPNADVRDDLMEIVERLQQNMNISAMFYDRN